MISEILIFIVSTLIFLQWFTQKRPKNFPPGPVGIPVLGYLPFIQQPIYEGLTKISEKYGSVFSLFLANHQVVVLSDVDSIKEAFKDERFSGRPPFQIIKDRSWGKIKGIIFNSGKDWLEQRRFVIKNLREFGFGRGTMESLIKDEINELLSDFRKQLGKPVDLDNRLNSAVLNSLWNIISGERYSQDDPRLNGIIDILVEVFKDFEQAGTVFFMEWFAKCFPNISGYTKIMNMMPKILNFTEKHIKEHQKSLDANCPRDLIDSYLVEVAKTEDPASSFYKEDGIQNLHFVLLDLFQAGSDTTSTFLLWVSLYMILHPDIQSKFQKEIDDVVGKNRAPALSDRPNMPYTEAIISESLRMSSIAPIGLMHATTEITDFKGYTLPKNTIIIPNFWHLSYDKNHWGDPQNFRPERFLNSNGTFKKSDGFLPFSTGKRVCLGESLARDEAFLFLTSIFQQFTFSVDPESPRPKINNRINGTISRPASFKLIINERKTSS